MKLFTKPALIVFLMSYFYVFQGFSQSSPQTANTYVKPYTEQFGFGSNMGYFSNGWTDKGLAAILDKAGANTLRASLPDYFIEQWGLMIRVPEFEHYTNDFGMKGITVFVGEPSAAHQDKTIYPGCSQPSKLFANLYTPIWNADGTVNKTNYYAAYIANLVQAYGDYVKIWEIVNEPDHTGGNPSNWLTRAPLPSELSNARAPFYHYIRMLRISYEVIKKYRPDNHITPGGLGYPEYLDALMRYTDNPEGGAVTAQYPNKGGAYFDMLSYHVYPSYFLSTWKDGGFVYTRNSDKAAEQIINHKKTFEAVLHKYGYNGSTYPKKDLLVTEVNVSRRSSGTQYGSDEMQRNFGMKALVLAQKNNIKQLHIYGVAESTTAPAEGQTVSMGDAYGLMGLYENLRRDAPGSEKLNQLGVGYKTTAQLLAGYNYDAGRTAALEIPNSMEGAAFRKDGNYIYVMWAKAFNDRSEDATAMYSFPEALKMNSVERREWNFASSGTTKTQAAEGISLNSAPVFFTPGEISTTPSPATQTITFASLPDTDLSNASFTLSASASSGLPVSFKIVSGPATLSGSSITLTATGTVTVEASQGGSEQFAEASPVKQSFVVRSAPTEPEPEMPTGPTVGSGKISSEFWANVKGTGVAAVPVASAPTGTGELSLFEAPAQQGYNYGQRIRGYVTAPVSGQYTFWIAGDDAAELYLSTSEDPADKQRIAHLSGWTYSRQWGKHGSQQSAKVTLEAGKRYYIEALHQQAWGGDNIAVGWQLPNGTLERPIAGSRLSPYETLQNLSSSNTANLLVEGTLAQDNISGVTLAAYPNPFSSEANVRFTVPAAGEASVEVYDVQGRLVRRLFEGAVNANEPQDFKLKAQGLSRGIYIIRLVTGLNVVTQKLQLDQ